MIMKCPCCGNETTYTGNPFRPFCGERCKLVDLGKWLSGGYRVPTTNAHEDEDKEWIRNHVPQEEPS